MTDLRPIARTVLGIVVTASIAAVGLSAAAVRASDDGASPSSAVREPREEIQSLIDAGEFPEAERAARELLAEVEVASGLDSLEAARVLDLLTDALRKGGKVTEPETRLLAERAVRIKENALGAEHVELAISVRALAHIVARTDGYAPSVPFYRRALQIREKALGPDHPEVARDMTNLALYLNTLGDYAAARPLFERALEILEAELGEDHPDAAVVRHGLGIHLRRTGDYLEAKRLHEINARYQEERFGPESGQVMGTLRSLANALLDLGDLEGARQLYERLLRWSEKTHDRLDASLAVDMLNLAISLAATGERDRAESLLKGALELREEAGRLESILASRIRVALAELLTTRGEFAAARPQFEGALQVLVPALGSDHPEVARSLAEFARLEWAMGRADPAMEKALRAETIARGHFQETARGLTEREALRYEQARASGFDVTLSALAHTSRDEPSAPVARVWDELVRSRALVLDEMALRHRSAVESEDPELEPLITALDRCRNRLASLVVNTPSAASEGYLERIREAREVKERAERALARRSAAFREALAGGRVGLPDVAAVLPDGSALVAYVKYDEIATGAEPSESSSYMALILRSGEARPVSVPLGPAGKIDSLIERWRREVGSDPRTSPAGRAEGAYREAGERLRRAIWGPVAADVREAQQVFIVPDGAVHLMSFAALPARGRGYLVESGPTFHYLSAERDLVRYRSPRRPGRGLLALGGPDFDRRPAAIVTGGGLPAESAVVASAASGADAAPAYRSPPATCGTLRSLTFRPLSGTVSEADQVEAVWAARAAGGSRGDILKLTGLRAGEAAFKRAAPGRRVLHLATHGFFMRGACEQGPGTDTGTALRRSGPGKNPLPPEVDSPLLLSGLALAGANLRGQVGEGEEDGILTAEEIASLDLSGVEWAVLSACETGVGKVLSGEGVLGLRRAFEVAGAATLIMSLWAVEDDAARAWMRELYEARFSRASTAEAVRQASLELLQAQRDRGRTTHPFFWGAFVAAGDWR